ncbi:cation-transporting P-type ATPase [Massilia horti]|uniref:Cation-transporting P-type ATPase n=1 Tax=Massilia horti TaxID=2562153 RepID=A0A4Y9SMS3_9BURK|nr:cation-transporting P-type ATPase [Massilia horti]
MDQFANASVIARAPGRLRIAIAGLYHSERMKRRLEAQLARHPAVTEVVASALTGRVLLLFRPAVPADTLLRELGLAVPPAADDDPPAPPRVIPQAKPAMSNRTLYPPWHLLDANEALASYTSSARRGLSAAEAEQRLRHGKNIVLPPRQRSSFEILLSQFQNTPVVLLALSAVVSLLTGALAETVAIGAVLVLNAAIGFVTERQAEATITSLSELVDDRVLVLRDGMVMLILSSHVVPGDILVLAPGTRVAADLRLLQASGLRIDESALTGESLPVTKNVAALPADVPLAERDNMAYRGTAVASGTGRGLVVGTGGHTEAGAIEALTRSTERPLTPVQLQLDRLGNQLVAVSTALCGGVLAIGLLRRQAGGALFRSVIALAVAAVPEGLPAVATTSLARGLRQMRARQVLIRRLHAVETIGSISAICLDKTGTLTMNQMSAVAIRTVRQQFVPGQDAITGRKELDRLLQVCVLCNEAGTHEASAESPLQSSATERALLELARRAGLQPGRLRREYPLLGSELRAEGRNYMYTTHATPDPRRRLVAAKGSPADLLALCDHYVQDGQVCACDAEARERILFQNGQMSAERLRVLGFAYAEVSPEHAPEQDGVPPLTWLGLVGLADPLRPGAARTIERFHEAGIRTTMLTGDQAGTAYQIGKALRLNDGGELKVINSDALDRMPPELLGQAVNQANIFSRVTPSDKLRIVKAMQAAGATVAMTGDGINDSPALRAADVGIAMGSGTDMALSVADVALKHDRLDSLLDAVALGRTISDNIRKSVHFLVSSNLSEILVVLGAVAWRGESPLTSLQLLWLNLLTDVLPAIALTEEPAEQDVMQRPPRDPRANLVGNADMLRYAREAGVIAGGTLSSYAYGLLRYGSGERARTVGFDTLVLSQLAHALFCRSEHQSPFAADLPPNPLLTAAIVASSLLQGAVHLLPGLRRRLGLTALSSPDLLAIAAGALVPLLVNARAKPYSSAATKAKAERSTSLSTTAPVSLAASASMPGAGAARPAP